MKSDTDYYSSINTSLQHFVHLELNFLGIVIYVSARKKNMLNQTKSQQDPIIYCKLDAYTEYLLWLIMVKGTPSPDPVSSRLLKG